MKTKLKIKNTKKRGFTLVEMTVVMGIIALIMTIGASALLLGRDAAVLDAAAEELLATIREAQNRAISIQNGSAGETKAWGVSIDNATKSLSLESHYVNGTDLTANIESTNDQNFSKLRLVSVDRWYFNGSAMQLSSSRPTGVAAFNAPFGRLNACVGSTTITWSPSDKPTNEWLGSCTALVNKINLTDEMRIRLVYKNQPAKYVIIKGSGDAYIE